MKNIEKIISLLQRDAFYADEDDDESSTYLPGPTIREFVEVEPNVVANDREDDGDEENEIEDERKKRKKRKVDEEKEEDLSDEEDVDEFENIEIRDGVPEVSGKVTVTTRRRLIRCA